MRTDRRTDGQTHTTKLIVFFFRNFEKAPKKAFVRSRNIPFSVSHNTFSVNVIKNNEINISPNIEFVVHYNDHSCHLNKSVSKFLPNKHLWRCRFVFSHRFLILYLVPRKCVLPRFTPYTL